MTLVTQGADSLVGVRDPRLRHRDLPVGGQILRKRPSRLVGDITTPIDIGSHVRGVVLDGLERPDGPSELNALLSVLNGHVQHTLRSAQHLGALPGRAPSEHGGDRIPTAVEVAEQGRLGDIDIIENQLGLLVRGYGLQQRLAQSIDVGRNDEQADAPLALTRPGRDDNVVGDVRVRHIKLDAVDDVSAVIPVSGRLDSARLPESAGFSDGQCGDELAACYAGQVLFLMGLGTCLGESDACHDHRGKVGPGDHSAPHLFEQDRQLDETETFASVLLRDDQAQPSHFGHCVPHFRRVAAFVQLHVSDVRGRTLRFEKLTGAVSQHLLDLVQAKVQCGASINAQGRTLVRPRLAGHALHP